MLKTLLITGCAGFIGSSLVEKIVDDYQIIGVDEFNDYYNPLWKEENVKNFLNHPHFKLYRTDIRDYQILEEIFRQNKIDKIIHLAARAGVRPSLKDPLLYEEVNVKGTLNLLELSRKNQIKHFIFASSSSVYGNQNKVPFSETDPTDQPISPYAATKKAGELFCRLYNENYQIKMTCLRFFTVYGPKGRPDMAPYLFTKAILNGEEIQKFGDGQTQRDYTYIDDIIEGINKVIEKEFDFEIFNLGNNNPVSLNDFIKNLEEITGKQMQIKQMPIPAGDVVKTYADIAKAKKLLGWQPQTNFKTGLEKFVAWYKNNRLLNMSS
ncbi:NAD-dependent epimerase/dehydratase family protein [Candidatus Beckwithbacteria bacterium]|nr:NAD-dependent epimerase/dehydratase family protein [Candidatus Beckwithbacteria bacterium]